LNWANFLVHTADFGETWFKETPFEDPQGLIGCISPITLHQNVTTPMMFILGEADYRTPPTAGGESGPEISQIPTVMCGFP